MAIHTCMVQETLFYICGHMQLCHSDLVESIKIVKLMDKSYEYQKMIRGNQGSVIPYSYIVMMKKNSSMSEMVSGYIQYHSLVY